MQRLAGSGQASEAGAPVASIMQSLTVTDQVAATLASEAGAPVGTKHAASGREWSGGGTTLAIAQQFLTISKVILGPAAPAAPRHGQVSGQAQVGNLWKPAWLGSATVPQWGHAACVVMLCSSHPFQLSHCSGDALKIPGLLFESWRTSSSIFTSILSKRC